MDLRDITPNKIPFDSPAFRAILTAAQTTKRDPIAIARAIARRPLRLRELLHIVEGRARTIAEGGKP